MSSAQPMPGFLPMDTLHLVHVTVEFQLADGEIIQGWMAKYQYSAFAYWQRIGTRPHAVHPVAWRALPLPIAQRNAA